MAAAAVNKKKTKTPKTPNTKQYKNKRLQGLQEATPNSPPTPSIFKSAGHPSEVSTPLPVSLAGLDLSQDDNSTKKKLAPRSSLQFKIGPQFTETFVSVPILDSTNQFIQPKICPRIDRGFELIDGEWIGYKRNYFTLVSSFFFENVDFENFAGQEYHIIDPNSNHLVRIKYFAIQLVSRFAEQDSLTHINLIQHTAKRDRGPQFAPPIHPVIPSELPDHDIIREAANVRNVGKILKMDSIFYFDKDRHDDYKFNVGGLRDYPHLKIFKVARYERVQFSSSINYKKPSLNNKRFKLFVELVGYTENEEFVKLAYTETPPLIVRGRSPSNYVQEASANVLKETKSPKPQKKSTLKANMKSNLKAKPKPFLEFDCGGIQVEDFDIDNIDIDLQNLLGYPGEEGIENVIKDQDMKLDDGIVGIFDTEKPSDYFATSDFSNFPLDDVETFNILSLANKELVFEDATAGKHKKKRGRKPKSKQNKTLDRISDPSDANIDDRFKIDNSASSIKKSKKQSKSQKITKGKASLVLIKEKQTNKTMEDPLISETHNILHEITNTYQNTESRDSGDHLKFETLNNRNFTFDDTLNLKEPFENLPDFTTDQLEQDPGNLSVGSNNLILNQLFDRKNIDSHENGLPVFVNLSHIKDDGNLSNIFTTTAITDDFHENEFFLMNCKSQDLKDNLLEDTSLTDLHEFEINPSEMLGRYDEESGFLG